MQSRSWRATIHATTECYFHAQASHELAYDDNGDPHEASNLDFIADDHEQSGQPAQASR